ncbi:MAG: type II toxin-antitoxin system RelE/ParE family toxin [Gammaproteobacteria bacterium]|nr:type II toxin-antitoxin system RelE/ParE family toxin [Gammaproteobacteria bacterium]
MKIEILGAARQDLLDGYRFYEKQAEAVGAYFLDTLISDIDSLTITGGVHSTHFGGYCRLLSKRFPFAVYYRIENQTARVYAVLDCRRSPAWIRNTLTQPTRNAPG